MNLRAWYVVELTETDSLGRRTLLAGQADFTDGAVIVHVPEVDGWDAWNTILSPASVFRATKCPEAHARKVAATAWRPEWVLERRVERVNSTAYVELVTGLDVLGIACDLESSVQEILAAVKWRLAAVEEASGALAPDPTDEQPPKRHCPACAHRFLEPATLECPTCGHATAEGGGGNGPFLPLDKVPEANRDRAAAGRKIRGIRDDGASEDDIPF